MTLLNPTGCDLKGYEQRLVRQKSIYAFKVDQLVWNALPDTVQQPLREEWGLEQREIPSYQQHRQQLHSALAGMGWPVQEEDLALLEEEIALADSFLRWGHATSWAMGWDVLMCTAHMSAWLCQMLMFCSIRYSRALREERAPPDPAHVPPPSGPKQPAAKRTPMIVRGNKVLASCKHDGLYYQGSIIN